jgi:hypothetical protein
MRAEAQEARDDGVVPGDRVDQREARGPRYDVQDVRCLLALSLWLDALPNALDHQLAGLIKARPDLETELRVAREALVEFVTQNTFGELGWPESGAGQSSANEDGRSSVAS